MKVMASRPASDADGIGTLIELLGPKTRTAVLDLVCGHFPDDPAEGDRSIPESQAMTPDTTRRSRSSRAANTSCAS